MGYAKAIVAAIAAVLAAVVPALAVDGPLGIAGWVNVVILAAGALQVFNSSNDLPGWEYGKLIAAVVSAAAVALSSALTDGVSRGEWVQVVIAGLGAFAVYHVPNKQRAGKHEAPDDVGTA